MHQGPVSLFAWITKWNIIFLNFILRTKTVVPERMRVDCDWLVSINEQFALKLAKLLVVSLMRPILIIFIIIGPPE